MVRVVFVNQGMEYRTVSVENAQGMPVPTRPEQAVNARSPTTSSTQQDGSANPANKIPTTPMMTANAFVTTDSSNLAKTAYQHVM